MRLPDNSRLAPHHRPVRYLLDCGREVHLRGFYVSPSAIEWQCGGKETVRGPIIERLPSVDPELLLRILLIGYLYGITSERKLGENRITLDPMWRSPSGANGYMAATLPILLAFAAASVAYGLGY